MEKTFRQTEAQTIKSTCARLCPDKSKNEKKQQTNNNATANMRQVSNEAEHLCMNKSGNHHRHHQPSVSLSGVGSK